MFFLRGSRGGVGSKEGRKGLWMEVARSTYVCLVPPYLFVGCYCYTVVVCPFVNQISLISCLPMFAHHVAFSDAFLKARF